VAADDDPTEAPLGVPAPSQEAEDGRVAGCGEHAEPLVARARPEQWRAWALDLARAGHRQLMALGLALVLGFGLAALSLVLFAALAEDVMEQQTVHLDGAVLAALQQFHSPVLHAAAEGFSAIGAVGVLVVLVVLLAWFARRGRWGTAVALLLTTAGAQGLNDLLKELFHRARPAVVTSHLLGQSYSFPSGHAMVSAAFFGFLAYFGWRELRGGYRLAWCVGAAVLILLIGLSRLYLGVHYLSDVAAGYLAGFLWLDGVLIGANLLARRPSPLAWRRRRASPGGSPPQTSPNGSSMT